jgi:hypothetical protein
MFGSHKRILTIVITVVSLLAMLAPAALAAPEWLHGIELTAPLGSPGDQALLTAPDAKFDIEFNILTAGMQVCDVEVDFNVFDQNGTMVGTAERTYAYEDLQKAVNPETFEDFFVGVLPDGWYDLQLKAHEVGYKHQPPYNVECDKNVWTDSEAKAFLLDRVAPKAKLVKPADNQWKGATFVTGQDFLVVGEAEDRWGIKGAWFEICPEGIWACLKFWGPGLSLPGDENWLAIGDVPAEPTPGIPGQWQTEWDSTTVPDGFYFLRICAEDVAGNTNCADSREDLPLIAEDGTEHFNPWPDAHWVYVNNRVEIPLQVGWNLISSPLLPYDTDIADVLAHLIAHGTVKSVWTMVYQGGAQVWKVWTPAAGPVDTLTKIVDGQGYWIDMAANDSLTIVGTWTTIGSGVTPPSYPVYDGWNLIGYTHWGRPTIWPTDTVGDYLGAGLIDNLQGLFYYDPWTNVWKKLYDPQNMVLGKGYWLSVTEAGVIRF